MVNARRVHKMRVTVAYFDRRSKYGVEIGEPHHVPRGSRSYKTCIAIRFKQFTLSENLTHSEHWYSWFRYRVTIVGLLAAWQMPP